MVKWEENVTWLIIGRWQGDDVQRRRHGVDLIVVLDQDGMWLAAVGHVVAGFGALIGHRRHHRRQRHGRRGFSLIGRTGRRARTARRAAHCRSRRSFSLLEANFYFLFFLNSVGALFGRIYSGVRFSPLAA